MNDTERPLYRHTQPGRTIQFIMLAVSLTLILIGLSLGDRVLAVLAVLIAFTISVLFGSLTVQIHTGRLQVWFGPGLLRRTIPLQDIQQMEATRYPWWYGYGLRLVPGGWLYRVSGTRAVRLRLASGKEIGVGTDEPGTLVRALEEATGGRRSGNVESRPVEPS